MLPRSEDEHWDSASPKAVVDVRFSCRGRDGNSDLGAGLDPGCEHVMVGGAVEQYPSPGAEVRGPPVLDGKLEDAFAAEVLGEVGRDHCIDAIIAPTTSAYSSSSSSDGASAVASAVGSPW